LRLTLPSEKLPQTTLSITIVHRFDPAVHNKYVRVKRTTAEVRRTQRLEYLAEVVQSAAVNKLDDRVMLIRDNMPSIKKRQRLEVIAWH